MIDRLRGRVLDALGNRVILDVGGIGYDVAMPPAAAERFAATGGEVTVHTHVVYGEDRHELYGFVSRSDRDAFRQVIGVSGVGPRSALALFSVLALGDLRSAILRDDIKALLAAPGVGRKLAARLVLELKDKAMRWGTGDAASEAAGPTRSDDDRAVAVLSDLGYRPAQAARAVELARRTLGEDAPFEAIVRQALAEAVTT